MMTGQYAWRKKGTGILPGDANLIVPPNSTTLPGVLKQAGYATGVVGKWHLGLGDSPIDWNREIRPGPREIGFDYSFIIPATGDRVPCVFVEDQRVVNLDANDPIRVNYSAPFPGVPTAREHPELLRVRASRGHDFAVINGVGRIGYMTGGRSALWVDEEIASTLAGKAAQFIDRHKAAPFFLYLATHDIHVPRIPHARFAGKTSMGPRGDAIAELDWTVGEVLAALERNGLTGDTLVIFSSDNGPVLDDGYRDEAVEKLGEHKPAGPLRGGKGTVFEGGTRVPLITRWPARIKPGGTSAALIGQVDLLASFAALTGGKVPPRAAPDSMNAMPALLGRSRRARRSLVEHAGTLALIEDDWKLIAPGGGARAGNARPQLYNLAADLGERNDLAARHPERVKRMTAMLERIRTSGHSRP
jgi:arylsulfatase A-like enzyme